MKLPYFLLLIITLITFLSSSFVTALSSPDAFVVRAYLLTTPNDFNGKVLRYKENPELWNDIPKLLATKNVPAIAQICVIGSWLLYHEKDFTASTAKKVFMMTSLNDKKCILTSDLHGPLGSMQHLTPYTSKTERTISFFSGPNFEGNAMRVYESDKSANDEPTSSTYVNSLAIVGTHRWTVTTTNMNRYCVETAQQNGICLMTSFLGGKQDKRGGIKNVRRGCSQANPGTLINVTQCFDWDAGFHRITPSRALKSSLRVSSSDCDEHGGAVNGTIDDDGLIGQRLNGSLGSGEYLKLIRDTKNLWKMEVFDRCLYALFDLCPEVIIEKEFMLIFAGVYAHHMNTAWDKGEYVTTSITEENLMEINHDMRVCMAGLPGQFSSVIKSTKDELMMYEKLSEIKEIFETKLGYRSELDYVMEINWLMANLIASVCYRSLNYDVNFLPRFLNIYHELYFTPIMEQWENPGKFPQIYKHVFGGFGMEKSISKISLCVYNSMMASEVVDAYIRPMDQTEKLLLPPVVR